MVGIKENSQGFNQSYYFFSFVQPVLLLPILRWRASTTCPLPPSKPLFLGIATVISEQVPTLHIQYSIFLKILGWHIWDHKLGIIHMIATPVPFGWLIPHLPTSHSGVEIEGGDTKEPHSWNIRPAYDLISNRVFMLGKTDCFRKKYKWNGIRHRINSNYFYVLDIQKIWSSTCQTKWGIPLWPLGKIQPFS